MQKSETCKASEKLLTTSKLVAVFFVQLNEAYQITVLLPMVVFMCRDFGIPSQWLGVYSSILNASFGFCQFCVSYLWGHMSDIYGRRGMIICGLVGTFLSMTVFGFSTSFEMALICRCLTGFFNGNLAVVKSYLADITDSSNRGYGFSIIGVSWGAGSILGSMLGGILLETNDVDLSDADYIRTTSVLKWSIFEHDFPFLLPTAVCGGIISLNALICTLLSIKDEKVRKRLHSAHYFEMMEDVDRDTADPDIISDIEMTSALTTPSRAYNASPAVTHVVRPHQYFAMHHSLPSHHDLKAMVTTFESDRLKLLSDVRETKSIDDMERIQTVSDFFKYTQFGHILAQYGITVISYYMFKEMGPVFMAQALEFNSGYIGYTQVCAGVTYFIFAIAILPSLLRNVKHTTLTAVSAAICAICAVLMPSIYWFTLVTGAGRDFMTQQWWLLLMACAVEWLGTMAASVLFVTVSCWLNNCVPDEHLGKANGVGQTVSAFVKGFGPLITGFIWSESITQMEHENTHYAVYYAYLPAAILYLPMIIDIIVFTPSNLQLTWEQREFEEGTV